MAATTTLLGLVTPTQGTLSGTWGDTVNYGISDYVDISVAGTLTLTNDGAVTLANTTGSSAGNSITSSLTGAGTVTAQFAIVRVTGTLTTAKVVTGPSYSKTYTVVNAATGGIVTFKASGQTGVSIAVGESAFVYFNGTDYVKVSGTVAVASFQTSLGGLTPSTATTGVVTLAGTLNTTSGGTGLTSFTAGDVPYYASGTLLSKLAIGTAGQFLTSTGTAPQWSTLSGVAVTTFSAGTTGFTPSSATSGAVTLAGTLATANGGTNLGGATPFTSGGVVYASSSSALATGSALTFDGANLGIGGSATRRLTVIGTGNDVTSGGIQTTNTNGGTGVQTGLWVSNGSQSAQFGLAGTGYSGYGAHVAGNAIVYNDQAITLMADNASTGVIKFAAGGNTEGMRLTSTGLGIKLSSPTAKLQIEGTKAFLLNLSGAQLAIDANGNASNGLGGIGYNWYEETTGNTQLFRGGSGNQASSIRFDGNIRLLVSNGAGNADGAITWATGLYVANAGNVGIGTSSPFASPKLTVFNSATISTGGDGGGNGVFIAATTGSASGGQLVVAGSDTAAIDKGGAIVFAGKWDTATNDIAQWAKIAGYKENATNNNYSGYLGFYTRANGGAATERARITSDGNFGLGVTPSAWGSNYKALQIFNSAPLALVASGDDSSIATNAYVNNSGTWFFVSTSSYKPTKYAQYLGQHQWHTATASGTANGTITFTQAMTLDASGALLLGTTSSSPANANGVIAFGGSDAGIIYLERQTGTDQLRFYTGGNRLGYVNTASSTLTIGTANYPLAFSTNDTERARIDASGNLGLGVTPSAWNTGYKAFVAGGTNGNDQVGGIASGSGITIVSTNYYRSSTPDEIYAGTGYAMKYLQSSGQHQWYTAASGTAGNAITFTQAMTLDASGRLMIGTTTPLDIATVVMSGSTNGNGLTVRAANSSGAGSQPGIVFASSAGAIAGQVFADVGGSSLYLNNGSGGSTVFLRNSTESARFDTNGALCVGTTTAQGEKATFQSSTISSANIGIVHIKSTKAADNNDCLLAIVKQSNDDTTSQVFVRFGINNYAQGCGQINGNGASSAAFGSFSDYRLKENIASLPSQLSNIMALRPVEFDYIESEGGGHQIGFIAQEMQGVYPDVVGQRDLDGMLTVTGWSKTEARLVKAMQEQQAIIESLKARLDAANL